MGVSRLSLLALTVVSLGCASVRPVNDPASFIAEVNPRVVYVTHTSGAVLTLSGPRVRGDSLLGTWVGASQNLALPLEQVTRVEAMQRDKTRTTLVIAGASLTAAALAYLITRGTADSRQPCNFEYATQFSGCDNPRDIVPSVSR
jgi:hypothetical protein